MITVNTHEAKTQLSRLLALVRHGEEVIIARSGKPVARLVPVKQHTVRREPGTDKGKAHVADDFNGPLPEEFQTFFK
ncbi:type II toxin-antitoxin system Phd/YefM family antitoxin [bacterium]|nr:type II toxin-antitoxin system Phd/YefM family antitoxin [bacterium]